MDTRYNMIIIKDEIKTPEIVSCRYNADTKKWNVKFTNGRTYSYGYINVKKLQDPAVLNPKLYHISRDGRELFDITAIYVFKSACDCYWHICFGDGSERDYHQSDLDIVESCLSQKRSADVFEYIKQIAGLSDIKNEQTGERLLEKNFEKISFVRNDLALAKYLDPSSLQTDNA